MATYNIVQIGWENENPLIGIVLLSKAEREKLDVERNDVVRVKYEHKTALALVERQFKAHVGAEGKCTVNTKLATEIAAPDGTNEADVGIAVGAQVEITKDVTESEYARFKRSLPVNPLAALFAAMQRGE
jgi:hypothetical protein